MPYSAYCDAIARMRLATPPLAAQYATALFRPLKPDVEPDIHHGTTVALLDHLFANIFAGQELTGERDIDRLLEISEGTFTDRQIVRKSQHC